MAAHSLLSLPSDILTLILQQDGVGPCELCRLECCCSAVRRLVDDDLWRLNFLRRRRPSPLGEPASWKAEYARRLKWSAGWRALVASTTPAAAAAAATAAAAPTNPATITRTYSRSSTQRRLRKLAISIVNAMPSLPPKSWATLVVDGGSDEPGVFQTINAALLCCKPYDTIQVRLHALVSIRVLSHRRRFASYLSTPLSL